MLEERDGILCCHHRHFVRVSSEALGRYAGGENNIGACGQSGVDFGSCS